MCRKNQLCGCALITFGLGLLVGMCLKSGFFCVLVSIMIICLCCWCAKKR